ncbi:bifunctional UDP-N-acetylmuramoyl-tripeptide:D-alanyl-D-alanine ligase/alanine racemase [Sediminibacterium goheungense]|uniref:Alanine racemase n=1 Tax=Sediminibacterium goheungense TaxID=1086393 RepID=A0A4R6J0N7_9BACT|nr:bifunctional UDP-N-acetylmuramoyl-tripeptide:D-alanyl-D-alanine ligase/alanine racemase [Sediminibacterium goheungense]TDO28760.1 alanine racemase [Sediminibacterium goheungense]
MSYSLKHIAGIIEADRIPSGEAVISQLLTDSRKLIFAESTLFFAIEGPRRDGHDFIGELYDRGLRFFVVQKGKLSSALFPEAVFLEVSHVLAALQKLAAYHRTQFNIPVIGITGSNGKTIVKEWLYQLLHTEEQIVRSPRSYNSQIGVPLSVWQLNHTHTLGIFEAGISQKGEMTALQKIIQPTIGIWTNIGAAHAEGFLSDAEKAAEKANLFSAVESLVYCKDSIINSFDPANAGHTMLKKDVHLFSWSRTGKAELQILSEEQNTQQTWVTALYEGKQLQVAIPFTDRISVDNAITCWCVLLLKRFSKDWIQQRMLLLEAVDMRMQLKKAVNNCYLLNDSYSNDTASLELALDFLVQQAGKNKTTLILSDVLQSGQHADELYAGIVKQAATRGISRLIGIGTTLVSQQSLLQKKAAGMLVECYESTAFFLQHASLNQFRDEYILLKGARIFSFERISQWLEQKVHQTVMEVNLTAMAHNLKAYQQHLRPSTKLMAMVKAFSYGSGSAEVARLLQFQKIDYLAVAYADEGVELRKAGISLPIMVMNVDEAGFDAMIQYNLEPEIYSFGIYRQFHQFLDKQAIRQYPVHIKFNTGMNRLGFEISEADELASLINQQGTMVVKSLLSHLVASETISLDEFTAEQVSRFERAAATMQQLLGYPFIKHIANSAGIFRHPEYQFDMVRLGIGLYGVDSAHENQLALQTVVTLKSTIAQIRNVSQHETVGYNRKGVLERDSRIATVRIGYADGFSRSLGNRNGYMWVRGRKAPVIGNVCMDMTMVDVTDIPEAKEGDEVEVFGKHIPVQELAKATGTIAYEIMTGISQRVKRIYVEE